MAEGTRYTCLEAANKDLQKTQGLMDDTMTLMDTRLSRLEETMGNMESMLHRVIHDKSVEVSTDLTSQLVMYEHHTIGLFYEKEMKVNIPRFNGDDAED